MKPSEKDLERARIYMIVIAKALGGGFEAEDHDQPDFKIVQEIFATSLAEVRASLPTKAILEYCEPHLAHMWAATIVGMILGCDFRDSAEALKKWQAGE